MIEDEREKKPLIVFDATAENLIESKENYYQAEDEIRKELKSTLQLLDEIIKEVKTQFDTVSKSDRTKLRYVNLYAETLSILIKQKSGILKDMSVMNEKRLINTSKLRSELILYKRDNKNDDSIDIKRLHNALGNMFQIS